MQQTEPRERILIVRLGAMGDVLHAMPAVAAVREALPAARLGWVIEERWAELLCGTGRGVLATSGSGRPLVDAIHRVNTKRWRSDPFAERTRADIRTASQLLRSTRYDVAIDFQGAIKSAAVAHWSRAESRAGFEKPRERLAALLYTRRVGTHSAHVIEQNLELASAVVGGTLTPGTFDVARDPAAEEWYRREVANLGAERYAILNPGAGWGAKCWPANSYAAVARGLAASGISSLINYGPNETALASEVEEKSGGTARKVLCSVSELVALTRRAAVLVGGDTGPLHLAAALKVPVVALFGPTDPARNGPYGTRSVVLRSRQSATSYKHHVAADDGLLSITPEEVIAAAKGLVGIG